MDPMVPILPKFGTDLNLKPLVEPLHNSKSFLVLNLAIDVPPR